MPTQSFAPRPFIRSFTCLACLILLLNGSLAAQDVPSETATQIVFGIEQRNPEYYNLYKQSIVIADLKQKSVGILVSKIAKLSYKPSPDKHYLAYAQVMFGRLARCEIRDLWAGAALIYTGGIAQQCIPLWSGDSQKMVMAFEVGNIWTAQIWNLKEHRLINTMLRFEAHDFGSWEANYSPEGSKMLFKIPLRDGQVAAEIMDLQTGVISSVPAPFKAIDWTPFWSPTGKRMALVATQGTYQWHTIMYEPNEQISRWLSDDWIPILVWSSDGKYMAYLSSGFHTLRLLDDRNNEVTLKLPDGEDLIYSIDWMTDRPTLIVITGGKKGMTIWQVDVARREWKSTFEQSGYYASTLSPNSRYMWVVYRSESKWHYAVVDLTNSRTHGLSTLSINRPNAYFWSQDSGTICWVIPTVPSQLWPSMLVVFDMNGSIVSQQLVDYQYNYPGCESEYQYLSYIQRSLFLDHFSPGYIVDPFTPLEVRQS